MATILITGGTGMIGTALTKELVKQKNEVVILTRKSSRQEPKQHVTYAEWDVNRQTIDRSAVERCDTIIHLAGANVSESRWTSKRKQEIRESRVKSSELIVKALREYPNNVKAVVSASAIGFYGPDPVIPNPKPFIETDPPADDFLASVVRQWENEITKVTELGKRIVILRTGIVLSREGGAYPEFKKPLKFGLAAIPGSGIQVTSWIAIDDLVRMYMAAAENEKWNGVYNAVAPSPSTGREMVLQIAKQQRISVTVHVPVFALKIILGEMSVEVLKSTTVSGEKINRQGFQFLYPTLEKAIRRLEAS